MIFFVVSLVLVGCFGNFLIPLMVGARDMAYPLLNMLSYWTIVPACALILLSFLVEGGAAAGGSPAGGTPSVLGNLPYYATSDILLHLIAHRRRLGDTVITMQREVAERLTARPGTRAYGRLSVAVALRASIEACLRLPATAFSPAPEVGSTVVRLRWRDVEDATGAVAESTVERVVRAAFAQRRKRLVNSLAATLGLDREKLEATVSTLGVAGGARAEDLPPEEFVRLAVALAPDLETGAAEDTDTAPPPPATPTTPAAGRMDGMSPGNGSR
jgi:16S rRNA A1518/A1519 N6-dimethyltransferase RsmA/KsgA/DIM1 with predicted DNA glycosylase/AP lyase activity